MTNKEKAKALWGIVADDHQAYPLAERRAAQEELLVLKKTAKVSWEKLELPVNAPEMMETLLALVEDTAAADAKDEKADEALLNAGVDPLDEPAAPEPLRRPSGEPVRDTKGEVSLIKPHHLEAAKRGGKKQRTVVPDTERGLISAMVRCELMDTSDSYALIVERVKAKYPNAQTTARSVASVAADLRKDGVEVASRRPSKAA